MPVLNERFFQMSNSIFYYGLTPDQLAVYSYLVCCAGQKDKCWPSVKTIAARCGLSENTVRKAVSVLTERGFINKVQTRKYSRSSGKWLQGNNHYYILKLPELPRNEAV